MGIKCILFILTSGSALFNTVLMLLVIRDMVKGRTFWALNLKVVNGNFKLIRIKRLNQ